MLLGYRDVDRGHILENVVYLELLRRDYRVYVGKVGEIDISPKREKRRQLKVVNLELTAFLSTGLDGFEPSNAGVKVRPTML